MIKLKMLVDVRLIQFNSVTGVPLQQKLPNSIHLWASERWCNVHHNT